MLISDISTAGYKVRTFLVIYNTNDYTYVYIMYRILESFMYICYLIHIIRISIIKKKLPES